MFNTSQAHAVVTVILHGVEVVAPTAKSHVAIIVTGAGMDTASAEGAATTATRTQPPGLEKALDHWRELARMRNTGERIRTMERPDVIFEDAGNPEALKGKEEAAREFEKKLRENEDGNIPQPLPDESPFDRED